MVQWSTSSFVDNLNPPFFRRALYIVGSNEYDITGFDKSLIPRLHELASMARGVQDAGSCNLVIKLLPNPVQ